DVDFLQMRDHDHRIVPPPGKVARRYLDGEALIRPVAELFHDLARLGAVLLDIKAIAGQGLQYLRRDAPGTIRACHHVATDSPLTLIENIKKGLAIEGQTHGPAQFRIVKGRSRRIDQHRARDIARTDLAQRLWRLLLEILECRDAHAQRDHVELPGEEGQV